MSAKHEHEGDGDGDAENGEDGSEDDEPVATPERSRMGLLPQVWGNEVGGGSGVVRVVD